VCGNGDQPDCDRAVALHRGAEIAFGEFAAEMQGRRVDGLHIAGRVKRIGDPGDHNDGHHHHEHSAHDDEPAILGPNDLFLRNDSVRKRPLHRVGSTLSQRSLAA